MNAVPVYNAQGEQVILGREVGQGLKATVFLVRNRPDQVARLYLQSPPEEEARKVQVLVQMHTPELEAVSVWPVNTLTNLQKEFAGYLRPFLNLGDYRELPHLYSQALRMKAFPRADWAFQARVAARVAHAFAVLHAHGQVMGDVNPLHVMVNSQGGVRLVNVDAYQARWDGQQFLASTTTPAFLPPELQEQELENVTRSENHDLFSLAVMVFLLLMQGHHPYGGVPAQGEMPSPARAIASDAFAYSVKAPRPGVRPPPETLPFSALPQLVQDLFEQAFSAARGERPSAQQWEETLTAFADSLVTCQEKAEHQHQQGRPCPWCELARIRQVSPFLTESWPDQGAEIPDQLQTLWQQAIHVNPPLRNPVIPELKPATPPPDLPLNLPSRPNTATEAQKENVVRWVLRIGVLMLIMLVTTLVQHSILAGLIVPTILILAFTVGRRLSVDWDAMIEGYQNWEGRLAERLLPARGRWQTYHQAITARRGELSAELQTLTAQRRELEGRYERENAHAEYQRDLNALEEQRRLLLQGEERQKQALEALHMQRRERAISDYLKRQPLLAGHLPHLNHRALLQLNNQGIRTAYDVQPGKLASLPEPWQPALHLWRQGLEDFLPVSAELVSAQELQQLRAQHAAQQGAALEQFRRGVNRFMRGQWGQQQAEIVQQFSEVKQQIRQHQQALTTLENLAKQG